MRRGKGTESEGVGGKERVFLLYEGDQGSYPHKVRREQRPKGEERQMMLRPWNDPDARPCPAGCSGSTRGSGRGREGSQGRCSLRSNCGNPGDVGLMNRGKNWPLLSEKASS